MGLIDTTTTYEAEIASKHPVLYKSLIPLLRRKPGELDAFLENVACNVSIGTTKTQAHCKFIALNGSKQPRVNDFARYLAARITDFAIPRSEIRRAFQEALETESTAPIDKLNMKARSLCTRLPKSGEGGEVLLSVLAETFLRLPQIFSKMVLKTSSEMHVHGSDGIHVGVNNSNGNLALYWGESKLYKNVDSAIRECFASLAPFLTDAGGSFGRQERDIQLMREGIDLNNHSLESALRGYLNPEDRRFNTVEYRGLCLIGFDTKDYPSTPNSKESVQLREEIETSFEKWKNTINARVTKESIASFVIEVFCLPFPSVAVFRNAFRRELGL